MNVKKSEGQNLFVIVCRENEEVEVEVSELSLSWISFHDSEDQLKVELSGNDQALSKIHISLYFPVKAMESLCKEFREYKEQADKEVHHKNQRTVGFTSFSE